MAGRTTSTVRRALAACAALVAFGCASSEIGDNAVDDGGSDRIPDGGDFPDIPGDSGDGTDGPGADADADADAGPCLSDLDCDDGIDCTDDFCDTLSGVCTHDTVDAVCSDGNPCTGDERCDPVEGCVVGTPPPCDDGIDCTDDECDPLTGACSHQANHALCTPPRICEPDEGGCVDPPACTADGDCTDHDACNGLETCGSAGFCLAGTAVSCNDHIDCTVDRCEPADGSCSFLPNDSDCSDGNPCDGLEVCDAIAGCIEGTPPDCEDGIPCTGDSCDPATGRCRHAPDNAPCADGVFCNGSEVCDAAAGCVPGTPPACADGILCTTDRCDTLTDRCVNSPDHSACSDRQFCNGDEVCAPGVGCGAGIAPVCSDGLGCTSDTCDPSAAGGAGACVYTPPDRDGDTYPDRACTGTDCDDLNATINPGSPESCNAVDDDCDGSTDETYGCIRGSIGSCATGCGSTGTRVCSNTCAWGSCTAPPETCNGVDDDCVSGCDNGWACCMGAATTQSCGNCGTQSRTCGASCSWGSWGPCMGEGECAVGAVQSRSCTCGGTESRSCTGSCSWGPWSGCMSGSCTPGSTQGCTTSCGSWGSQTCGGSCTWGFCNPPAETCNGVDDDCASGCDNGWACCAGSVSSCTNGCGVAGSRSCSGSCSWGSCCSGSEVCGNTCDDNCDGFLNEGCGPSNDECTGATTISLGAGRTTVTGSTSSASSSTGSCTGANDVWYRFTLAQREIVSIDTYGSAYDTYLGFVAGSCGTAGGCTDDACGTLQSQIVQNLAAGTYYIVVDGYSSGSGNFTLNIEHLPAGTDTALRPLPAGTWTQSGTTSGSSGYSSGCPGGGGPEHVYYWTRCPGAAGGAFSANTCGLATWDTVLSVRSGPSGTELGCNDDSCGLQSSMAATIPGNFGLFTFYVDGYWSGASGSYSVSVTRP